MSFAALKEYFPRKISIRLGILYTVLTALVMLTVLLFTLNRVSDAYKKDVENYILHEALEIQTLLKTLVPGTEEMAIALDVIYASRHGNITEILIQEENGSVHYQTEELISQDLLNRLKFTTFDKLGAEDIMHTRFPGYDYMGQVVSFFLSTARNTTDQCVVAIYPRSAIENIAGIKRGLLFVMISSLFLSSLVGYFMAKKAYSPLRRIIEKTKKIKANDMNLRLEVRGSLDELDELANTFNELFDRLQQAFEREREFTSQVTHELRTPLTAIRGSIETILLDDTLSLTHRDSLINAIKATDRLIILINRLLFLSRADSGLKTVLRLERCRIKNLVEKACEWVFPEEGNGDNRCTLDIPARLECILDPEIMLRMIGNLVDNAKRHTPSGTPIMILAGRENESLVIKVQDKGGGIQREDRKRIFNKFVTLPRVETVIMSQGTGLGLSIARAIVQLHGGDLAYEDTAGGGSTFVCRVPYRASNFIKTEIR